ncbi:hypothetical protein [Thermoactinomyces sp. DSM 45892]|uniref:hypothetical protein n=1 Tax=Thermoactinomyces sp. DSM 45892 TaxID=1882753 RepID=UPI000B813965|nr:hypothetical protein [Thermoactinomyces sp. DSM 45892]
MWTKFIEMVPFVTSAVFLLYIFIQMNTISTLREENKKLRTQVAESCQTSLEEEVRLLLKSSSKLDVIKHLRTKKGLSILDAKKLVDSISNS